MTNENEKDRSDVVGSYCRHILALWLWIRGQVERGTCGSERGFRSQTIKIGLVAPLTGNSGIMGESQQHGYELAMSEINASGGINGATIELVTYDDQADPQKSASGAQKFADDDSILAIGGSCNSSATLAMTPITDAAGLPELVVSSSSPKLER